jgi:ribosomal protein S18 acetylase RimI-like enzyme
MRYGITRADRDKTPIYLETETESNVGVGFYQRLGFDVIEELTPEGLDVLMWLMTRPPPSSRP